MGAGGTPLAATGGLTEVRLFHHRRCLSRSSRVPESCFVFGLRAEPQKKPPVLGTRKQTSTDKWMYERAVYRSLAIAAGTLNPDSVPNFANTQPAVTIGPFPQWGDPRKIVTMDPFGAIAPQIFAETHKDLQILPTIAITRAHIDVPEVRDAMRTGRLKADGTVLLNNGSINVTKAAIEPVWYLPGVAERMGVSEVHFVVAVVVSFFLVELTRKKKPRPN